MKKQNILFICKYNRFRSKIAEAYFKKINKNKNLKVKSAGIIKGSPLSKFQKAVAKEKGIKIKGPPQGLSTKLLKWQNVVIIVADDVPKSIFKENEKYGKKTIVWNLPDVFTENKKETKKTISAIMKKVEELVRELK